MKEQFTADVWAFGMVLYQIITDRRPFDNLRTPFLVQQAIEKGDKPPLPPGNDLVIGICDNCWAEFPDRPEFYQIVYALKESPEPLFPGTDLGQFAEYRDRVFARTAQSDVAHELFSGGAAAAAPAGGPRLEDAAAGGDTAAMLALAKRYAEARNYAAAAAQFKAAADAGNSAAMAEYGACLLTGHGAPQNLVEAAWYFRASADAGNPLGIEEYARALDRGRGVAKDPVSALQYYKMGADRGRMKCQYYYARKNLEGKEIAANHPEALKYYRIAHNAGYAEATCDLATMHLTGKGVRADLNEAVRIYGQAVAVGCADAAVNLGGLHQRQAAIRDMARAVQLYRFAAEKGSAAGKVALASCLKAGDGVPADAVEARRLYREVADTEIDDPDATTVGRARHNLAMMYVNGEGGPRDITEAYRYFGRAAEAGVPRSAVRYAELTVNPPAGLVTDRARARRFIDDVRAGRAVDPNCRPTADDVARAATLAASIP